MYLFLGLLLVMPLFVGLFSAIGGLGARLRLLDYLSQRPRRVFLIQLLLIVFALACLGLGLYRSAGSHWLVLTAYVLLPMVPLLVGLLMPLFLLALFQKNPRLYSLLSWYNSLVIFCLVIGALTLGSNPNETLSHQLLSLGLEVLGLSLLTCLNLIHHTLARASADLINRRYVHALRQQLEEEGE